MTLIRQITDAVAGATMVVATFAALLLSGEVSWMSVSYCVPIAAAVGVVHASEPGKLVDVTTTGAAAPVRAAVAYAMMLIRLM